MFCCILDHDLSGLALNSLQFSDGPELSPHEVCHQPRFQALFSPERKTPVGSGYVAPAF